MLKFQPPGFGHQVINTSLGSMIYYTQTGEPWDISKIAELPPLLFLHNFGGGASSYECSKVYPAFANQYRILAPDLIGWGESDHPVRDYQIQDYLTTISEFIHQTCDQPVTVVASSLTAAFAIRLAISEPDLFKDLFLFSPSGFDDFGQGAGRRLPLSVINLPFLDNLIYGLGAENEVAVSNFLRSFLFAKPERVTQEMVEAYLTSAQKSNAKFSALAFLRGDLYFDLSLYIQQLRIPTVFLWGEEAQFTNINLGRRLASLNKNAIRHFQGIANTGILPHLESPEVVIGLLYKYL
ncbi:alpha/beta hydrolase [Anabaena cylindrica FACHB-243]|uniref:Alpha/beta hydrolase fold protein n=1 Tax=Anabaena cylindrica (strain ATCC 27899 / PCC 7122) TaxID=272123 RepID=K9ZP37_ANACC|nr:MULTISPECIES: alpha/beta hydrolase [Anabaena]AFZ60090.1 alpha/beta hydrolase fold protein [Anabaena cylindrica PCC 7122]MBD2417854.1 alpha/beta hydrolase [Anabaena cylindrica FACHB-243]MBY5282565.1 alpha/beta hydrolase [Anabaena sp. CCAP 1446/1C]MBY5310718.1 alpha/beta hydrolase [Anabaena sp. CCAP 1446/1C]MCM2404769.1 alpha/beta hydrolase [Anabaena sp. CCAP 1446/1C]